MGKRKSENVDQEYELFKRFKEFQRTFLRAQRNSRDRDPTPPSASQPLVSPASSPPRSRSSSSSSSGSSSRSSSASSAGRHSGRSSRGASRDRHRSQSNERGQKQPGPDSAQTGARSKIREPSHIQDITNQDDSPQSTSAADYLPPPLTATDADRAPSPPPPPPGPDSVPADAPTAAVAPTELDDELLQILGDDPSKTKITGKDIQTDLAVRLQHIATSGLTKEVRKELLEKYLPPGNCTLIDAPELNPEVKAAISESTYKRDKAIKIKQKQLASATSCVAEALTILLSSESRNMTLIKLLMDATKLLCDGQNQDSVTRRNFVLYNLKKELKDQLQATKIDKFLFSQDLADTLKTAKAISKSGADMKVTPVQQNTKKVSKPATKTLNWRAPQQNHKPRGPPRSKEAARKPQPDNSSKQSSRRPPTSSRTRQ